MNSIASISRPALAPLPSDPDVVVVGAGAAGIAAARRCLALGLSVAVVEARDRVGGRAVTASFGGHPIDLGAHWLHAGQVNPLLRLGLARGEPLRRAPGRGPIVTRGRLEGRAASDAHGRAFAKADHAISLAAREPEDRSLLDALPPLGRWRPSVMATLAVVSGRPLGEVSAKDFPSEEFGDNWFARGGYGALIARLAGGLPIALGCPVRSLDWSGAGVVLDTERGRIGARAAIVTVPVAVLAAGAPRFVPTLPADLAEAVGAFLPGTYEHVVLNWPGSPFRKPDRLVKLVTGGRSFGMMTNMDGAPFHYLDLGHASVAPLRGRGAAAVGRLARDLLAGQFGARSIGAARILAVTDWVGDPWARSAWAVAPPGRFRERDVLGRPLGDRVWFAGEANMREMWGTAGGAWDSGEVAADALASRLRAAR